MTFVAGTAAAAGEDGGDDEEGGTPESVADVEGAGAEPGAASSVIQAGNVRPRPLPAILVKWDV